MTENSAYWNGSYDFFDASLYSDLQEESSTVNESDIGAQAGMIYTSPLSPLMKPIPESPMPQNLDSPPGTYFTTETLDTEWQYEGTTCGVQGLERTGQQLLDFPTMSSSPCSPVPSSPAVESLREVMPNTPLSEEGSLLFSLSQQLVSSPSQEIPIYSISENSNHVHVAVPLTIIQNASALVPNPLFPQAYMSLPPIIPPIVECNETKPLVTTVANEPSLKKPKYRLFEGIPPTENLSIQYKQETCPPPQQQYIPFSSSPMQTPLSGGKNLFTQVYPATVVHTEVPLLPEYSLTDSSYPNSEGSSSTSQNYGYNNEQSRKRSANCSNKRGKKHFQGSIDEDLEKAASLNKAEETGLRVYFRFDKKCFYVIDEEVFYNWIRKQRPGYSLEKASLFEKLNKSRACNRVNPRQKTGKMPIKYLRIDTNPSEFGPDVEADLEAVRQADFYKNSRLRIYSYRDWGYIPEIHFYYVRTDKKQ